MGEELAAHLKLTCYHYVDVDDGRAEVTICHFWHALDVPNILGTYPMEGFLNREAISVMRAGEISIINDLQTDLPDVPPAMASLKAGAAAQKIHAFIAVPYSRNGRWLAYLAVADSRPRRWTNLEIELVREISNLVMPRIERVRAEAALRASEEKYRTLFNSIDEGFCTFDMIFDDAGVPIDYRFVEYNPAFERHTGLSGAVGKTVREFLPDQDRHWFETYGRVAMTGEPVRVVRYGEALKRWFEVYAFRIGEPEQRRVAALFCDITVRKEAELSLQANQERKAFLLKLSDALRPLSGPAAIKAEASRILGEHLDVNRAAYAQVEGDEWIIESPYEYGIEPKAEGRHPIAQFGRWIIDEFRAGKPLVIRDLHTDGRFEQAQRAAHEAYHILAAVAVPLMKDGDLAAVLVVHSAVPRDWNEDEIALIKEIADRTWAVVEQARAESALRAAAEALREADRRKDEFLAMLAHELRNPLAAISSAVELFRTPKPQELPPWVPELMADQVQNLSRMIDDLMDISRVTRGKVQLHREPVELPTLVQRATEAVRESLAERKHKLSIHYDNEPLRVEADATRLEQILVNLLNNAAKYTEPGGQIFLNVQREQSEIVIRVKDTGIGLSADTLSQIFEMFTQIDASIDRSRGGLGIGLTLVKALVEMHGGSVSAASPGLGQGSEFTVRLPALDPSVCENQRSTSETHSSRTGRKVLVVDDNQAAASLLGLLLRRRGHEVQEVHDGPAVLQAVQIYRPEVVLLDIGLPQMDGYQVATALRANPEHRNLLLIAVSGYGQEEDRQRSREAGFDHHLIKPVHSATLAGLIAETGSSSSGANVPEIGYS